MPSSFRSTYVAPAVWLIALCILTPAVNMIPDKTERSKALVELLAVHCIVSLAAGIALQHKFR